MMGEEIAGGSKWSKMLSKLKEDDEEEEDEAHDEEIREAFNKKNHFLISDDPVPISEPRQSLIAPCLGLGAHEVIAGYTEFSLQRCQ